MKFTRMAAVVAAISLTVAPAAYAADGATTPSDDLASTAPAEEAAPEPTAPPASEVTPSPDAPADPIDADPTTTAPGEESGEGADASIPADDAVGEVFDDAPVDDEALDGDADDILEEDVEEVAPLTCDAPVASVEATTRFTGEATVVDPDGSTRTVKTFDWQAPEQADPAMNWAVDDSSVRETPCEVLDTVAEDATDVDVVVVSYENGKPAIDVVTAEDKSEALAVVAEEQSQPETIAVAPETTMSVDLRMWEDPREGVEWRSGNGPYTSTPWSSAASTSNDPLRGIQDVDYDRESYGLDPWGDAAWKNIEYVWKYGRGAGVTVAVVDTGVDGTHEDLSGQILPGYDFISGATGPQAGWADVHSHGTHVAGIIAAKDNNGIGITGLAPEVQILPVKVLGDDGSGSSADVARGIIAATDAGVDIINLSLGSAYPDPALQTAVEYAQAQGVVLVAAGGNSPYPGYVTSNGENYPASYAGVIGVASQDDAWCGGIGGEHIDITAYGCRIMSTVPGNGYAQYSGTSMATPQVAAGIALLMSAGVSNQRAAELIQERPNNTIYTSSVIYWDDADCPYEMAPDDRSGCVNFDKVRLYQGNGRIRIPDAMRAVVGIQSYEDYDYYGSAGPPPPAPQECRTAAGELLPCPGETWSTPPGGSSGGSGGGSAGGSSGGSASEGGGGGSTHDIREVRPAIGPVSGGNQISLIGFGMTTATEVKIGGKPALFRVVNDAHIEVTVPAGDTAGSADVFVNLGPTVGSILAPGGYTYSADFPPATDGSNVIDDLPPTTGPGEVTVNEDGEPTVRLWTKKAILTTTVDAARAGDRVKVYQKADGAKWKRVKKAKVKADGSIRVKVNRLADDSMVRIRVGKDRLPLVEVPAR